MFFRLSSPHRHHPCDSKNNSSVIESTEIISIMNSKKPQIFVNQECQTIFSPPLEAQLTFVLPAIKPILCSSSSSIAINNDAQIIEQQDDEFTKTYIYTNLSDINNSISPPPSISVSNSDLISTSPSSTDDHFCLIPPNTTTTSDDNSISATVNNSNEILKKMKKKILIKYYHPHH